MSERKSIIRTSITGMDGSGKSSAYRQFVRSVPPEMTVVRISRFSSVILNGQEQIVDRDISQALDNFHSWADSTKNRKIVSVANAMCVMFAWRVQQNRLTRQYNPDLVLALRDPYIDPMAYAHFYSKDSLGSMTMPNQERLLRRLHGAPHSHSVIFLDVDPHVAVERINRRIQEESNAKDLLERSKWVHLHENVADLTAIRKQYRKSLEYFQRNYGTSVTEIDTVNHSKPEVARMLYDALVGPFKSQGKTNPSNS